MMKNDHWDGIRRISVVAVHVRGSIGVDKLGHLSGTDSAAGTGEAQAAELSLDSSANC